MGALPALVGIALLAPRGGCQEIDLVRNGEPQAVIVDGGTPQGARSACEELRKYLEVISGARLEIAPDAPPEGTSVFVGGEKAFERIGQTADDLALGRDGFVVRTVGNDLVLVGAQHIGTLWAVYDFLENDLGCHWFWPGEIGEVVPRHRTVQVAEVDRIERPDFAVRWVGRQDWALKNRMNTQTGEPDGYNIHWFVHTWLNLVPPAEYADDHPEYYSQIDGVRLDPRGPRRVNLCTTNPEVAEAAARTIGRIVAENPGTDMISVDPEDTQQFCQCDECLEQYGDAGLPYEQRNSRRVFDFTNQVAGLVADKHPDLIIKTIAYHSYVRPPANPDWRPRDNVAIQFCRFMCHNHALGDPACPHNQGFDAWYREWRERTSRIFFYEYYWKVSWLGLPWPITRMLRADLPRFRDDGLLGIATQFNSNYATNGLGYWLAAKLLWDADANVDALLTQYYRAFFGEAAPHARAYYETLGRAAAKSGVHLAGQRPYADVLTLFSPQLIDQLDQHLTRASAAAQTDAVRERIRMLRAGVEHTRRVQAYLAGLQGLVNAPDRPLWAGMPTDPTQDAVEVGAPLARSIREFLLLPENAESLDQPNNYIEALLQPEHVLRNLLRSQEAQLGLTRREWLEARGGRARQAKLPATFSIWVYGNDLDFQAGEPEHALSLKTPEGEWEQVGGVGADEADGNRRNLCFVIAGLDAARYLRGAEIEIKVENTPGGPYASQLFAFWLMPDEAGLTPQEATRRVEQDIEAVRAASFGFTEYGYSGFMNQEDGADVVPIELPGFAVDGD